MDNQSQDTNGAVVKFTQAKERKPKRSRKVVRPMPQDIKAKSNMTERTNLETHVDLCELRYNQLEQRMSKIEQQVKELNIDLQDFKEENRKNFADIKAMLSAAKDEKFKTMVTVAGTIIVALLGVMGYLITHIK